MDARQELINLHCDIDNDKSLSPEVTLAVRILLACALNLVEAHQEAMGADELLP